MVQRERSTHIPAVMRDVPTVLFKEEFVPDTEQRGLSKQEDMKRYCGEYPQKMKKDEFIHPLYNRDLT